MNELIKILLVGFLALALFPIYVIPAILYIVGVVVLDILGIREL
jgi:hypothetical protein